MEPSLSCIGLKYGRFSEVLDQVYWLLFFFNQRFKLVNCIGGQLRMMHLHEPCHNCNLFCNANTQRKRRTMNNRWSIRTIWRDGPSQVIQRQASPSCPKVRSGWERGAGRVTSAKSSECLGKLLTAKSKELLTQRVRCHNVVNKASSGKTQG